MKTAALSLFLCFTLALPVQLTLLPRAAHGAALLRPGSAQRAAAVVKKNLRGWRGKAVAGAIALTAVTVPYVHKQEVNRGRQFELTFSEVSAIKDDAAAKGIKLGPEELIELEVNDGMMKVFEASNRAVEGPYGGDWVTGFAEELHYKMRLDGRRHKLPALLQGLPQRAADAKAQMKEFGDAAASLGPTRARLGGAWSYTTTDNYHWVSHPDR